MDPNRLKVIGEAVEYISKLQANQVKAMLDASKSASVPPAAEEIATTDETSMKEEKPVEEDITDEEIDELSKKYPKKE